MWSAERFVEGSAATARHFGMPPLLIGMVIVGFGTSTPELIVSSLASLQGNPAVALGNAYGSNIANIALILGLTAILNPISVNSKILRRELPVLAALTALTIWLLRDGNLERIDALLLMGVFAGLMIWTIWQGISKKSDSLGAEVENELEGGQLQIGRAVFWLVFGLILLILSSRMLVWGAVQIAADLGVSDLVIGLTVVALGTSLPELASSIIAARKGEHDIAFGNIIGSNLFNTLAVVGIAGTIQPTEIAPEVMSRDLPVMTLLTFSLFIIGYGFRGPGRINRIEGTALLTSYIGYVAYVVYTTLS